MLFPMGDFNKSVYTQRQHRPSRKLDLKKMLMENNSVIGHSCCNYIFGFTFLLLLLVTNMQALGELSEKKQPWCSCCLRFSDMRYGP